MTVALTLTVFGLRGERVKRERDRKEGEIKGKSRQREQSQ